MRSLTTPLFIVGFIILFINNSYAQSERIWNWTVGQNRAISFNAGGLVAGTTASSNANQEGGCYMSDASGTALFYTDGGAIWNPNGTVRQADILASSGNSLPGNPVQNGIIVPKPGATDVYYILSNVNGGNIVWTEYDYGANTYSPSVQITNLTGVGRYVAGTNETDYEENMSVVGNAAGDGYWLGVKQGTWVISAASQVANGMSIWPITAAGVGTEVMYDLPVVSPKWSWGGQKCVKFSNDGKYFATSGVWRLQLIQFDNATGVLGPSLFTINDNMLGVEFSINNANLFAVDVGDNSINQFDIAAATGAIVNKQSITNLSVTPLTMGPDCNIYYTRNSNNCLGRISDTEGAITYSNCVTSNANIAYGIPTFVSSFINSDCSVNPLPLSDFKATVDGDRVKVNWETVLGESNDYFQLERSIDGETWETITLASGAEYATGKLDYEEYDENPALGFNYYRMKQVDIDGKSETSETRKVNFFKEVNEFAIYPSEGMLMLAAYTDKESNVKVQIYDPSGRLVQIEEVYVSEGYSDQRIEIKAKSQGIYIVKVINEGKSSKTFKVKI